MEGSTCVGLAWENGCFLFCSCLGFKVNRSRFFKVQGLGLRLERKPSEV